MTMADLLNKAKFDNLPHPLYLRLFGSKQWWPAESICVQTGLTRIDVCGMIDIIEFGGVAQVRDADGNLFEPEDFYLED